MVDEIDDSDSDSGCVSERKRWAKAAGAVMSADEVRYVTVLVKRRKRNKPTPHTHTLKKILLRSNEYSYGAKSCLLDVNANC